MTVLRVNTIAGIGTTTFGPTFGGNLEFNSQNYIVLPKGSSTQQGVLRETVDVVGTGGTFYDNLVLAMPFNEATGLRDVSSRNRNPGAYGGVSIATTVSKYYGSSVKFDGVDDYMVISGIGSDFQLGTGDFTIEFWWNGSASGTFTQLVGTLDSSAEEGTWRVGSRFNSLNYVYFARGTGTDFQEPKYNINVNDGSWHHIACIRSAGTISMYVDGANQSANLVSGTTSIGGTCNTINTVKIGYNQRDNAYATGFLQDLRVYKGLAKYTANFTPPDRIAEVGVGFTTGQLRYNTDSNLPELYDGNQWVQLSVSQVGLGTGGDTEPGARGIFGGGATPTAVNTIDYINISSTGNATDFGDNTRTGIGIAACASSTRGLFLGGGGSVTNTIDFITISSTGNAADYGDLVSSTLVARGCSNSTRGIVAGGYSPATPTASNIIQYVTIASLGNGVDFGDLTRGVTGCGACSSSTRGIFGGGYSPSTPFQNIIDFITISTLGNAFDFGDLTQARRNMTALSNPTRGIFALGEAPGNVNTIDFITISTIGNATNFGDTVTAAQCNSSCSSSTRGVFGGYEPTSNTLEYITILTQGNAVDFGDLIQARNNCAGLSNAHGGL